ncbi:hypothetical protein BJ508DRAFT_378510 [Ascobolus immersus RN42]|uniref:Uncharacterized protein n=1 Tax=Ascobolus immersus RN42 TaxID=1160509 RepID=A0A3N4HWB7_ASCIM|nr:hypothetical protein BJ508DRAFT_378510 [Ascobolus immersus RN42]
MSNSQDSYSWFRDPVTGQYYYPPAYTPADASEYEEQADGQPLASGTEYSQYSQQDHSQQYYSQPEFPQQISYTAPSYPTAPAEEYQAQNSQHNYPAPGYAGGFGTNQPYASPQQQAGGFAHASAQPVNASGLYHSQPTPAHGGWPVPQGSEIQQFGFQGGQGASQPPMQLQNLPDIEFIFAGISDNTTFTASTAKPSLKVKRLSMPRITPVIMRSQSQPSSLGNFVNLRFLGSPQQKLVTKPRYGTKTTERMELGLKYHLKDRVAYQRHQRKFSLRLYHVGTVEQHDRQVRHYSSEPKQRRRVWASDRGLASVFALYCARYRRLATSSSE